LHGDATLPVAQLHSCGFDLVAKDSELGLELSVLADKSEALR
jgi:hypothetical protein